MTQSIVDTQVKVWVAIDISKERHDVLLVLPNGQRKGFRISNHKADFDRFAAYLSSLEGLAISLSKLPAITIAFWRTFFIP